MRKLILASNSPRRKELLSSLGLEFDVIPDNTPEVIDRSLSPCEIVKALARFKGENVAKTLPNDCTSIIIAADTVVALDNEVLGKPADKEDAERMLKLLSGKVHCVYTGVYVTEKRSGKSANFYEKTEVCFKNLDINEIKDYINTGEPMDKAGAYGIQNLGSLFVERLNGDYFNVVGLPVCRLGKVLTEEFDIKLF